MKLLHSLPLFIFLVAGPGAFGANAFVYSSGPLPRTCSSLLRSRNKNCANGDNPNFASSPRSKDRYRQRQDNVNQAFRELQEELGDTNQRDRRSATTMRSPQYPFENVDKESAKKWVEKAIDLASDFNKDFAATSKERDATDEVLQKSRDLISRIMYNDKENEATDDVEDQGSSLKQPGSPISSNKTPNTSESTSTPPTPPLPEKPQDVLSETPNTENRSNEEMFQVAVDLPGVERTDVDVTLDGDFLVIEATRNSGSDGQPRRKYLKKIAFVENEVDMDKMEASLQNGVLLVSAPKNKVTEIKRKILIT